MPGHVGQHTMKTTIIRERLMSLAFWANPVVKRDLTVQLRGAKSYWFQGVYLLLLGVLCVAGYATATLGGAEINIVAMSNQLILFYYFIYVTLAALICLIAPALTAASITTERQRLTMDLLTTTPMTASELLMGKLLSSTAFLSLLLVLSVPASALCIILGGATIADLLKVYLLIALDGLVLASIGLYFSATTKTSVQSIVWTYATVIAFVFGTFMLVSMERGYGIGMGGAGTHADITAAIAALNPFGAVLVGTYTCDMVMPWGATISTPVWIPSAVIAVLFIRLLVTSATYRMGGYGGNPAGSLRRQLLFIIVIVAVCVGNALPTTVSPYSSRLSYCEIAVLLFGAAFVLILPALFVPVAPADSAPGTVVYGRFDLRRLFRPEHASSLPMFTAAMLVGAVALYFATPAATVISHIGQPWTTLKPQTMILLGQLKEALHLIFAPFALQERSMVLITAAYVWSFGFFMWSVSRRAGSWLKDTSAARALSFAMVTTITILPCAALGFSDVSWDKNDLQYLWTLKQFLHISPLDPEYLATGEILFLLL